VRALAPDPRKDLIYLLEGKRAAEPGPMRDAAMQELEAKGYRILPREDADQAELWVDVIAFVDERNGTMGGGPGGPGGGGMGRGGGMRPGGGAGGGRGDHGGSSGARSGAAPEGPSAAPGMSGKPAAAGPGVLLVVQLVDPKTGQRVWYGRMDLDAALKTLGRDKPQTFQEQIRRFLAPLPRAAMPSAE
jgi:hypothetical protein